LISLLDQAPMHIFNGANIQTSGGLGGY
jgi:hypothetical protein